MQLRINEERKELKSHGSAEFPVNVSLEMLSRYERGAFLWHWHPEVELTYVRQGEIDYQVNDVLYHLKAGEGLLGNANTLHTGHMHENQDCLYLSVTFHPRVLGGFENSLIQKKYVDPLIGDPGFSSLHFDGSSIWHGQVLLDLQEIYRCHSRRDRAYELEIILLIGRIWLAVTQNAKISGDSTDLASEKNLDRLRAILSYIHFHYADRITLEDIAAAANICKSECCRFFKKYMKESLFEYLLHYRIEQSLPLLSGQEESITEIAGRSGFSNPCYFAKVFKREMGCSPTEYRSSFL